MSLPLACLVCLHLSDSFFGPIQDPVNERWPLDRPYAGGRRLDLMVQQGKRAAACVCFEEAETGKILSEKKADLMWVASLDSPSLSFGQVRCLKLGDERV